MDTAGEIRTRSSLLVWPRSRRATGYYLYGIMRAQGWRQRRAVGGVRQLDRIRFRDLEAVVTPAKYDLPELGPQELVLHQRELSGLACHCTVLPVPPGLIFIDRRAVVRFMDDQYLALVEGLALLEGHWEFRLHLRGVNGSRALNRDQVTESYDELQRMARATVDLPAQGDQLLGVAFLVERTRWIEFVERVDDLGSSRPELEFDLTGPWPPYDFVRIVA